MKANLPNAVTAARILATPWVAVLLLRPTGGARLLAFVVFLAAALSDLWDGYLARRRGETTPFGKLADPVADKLLLVATLVPFYLVTRGDPQLAGLPVIGGVPLWAVLVLLGRELLVTAVRIGAALRGFVHPAGRAGKRKAVAQNVFVGATILWLAYRTAAPELGWQGGFWSGWDVFHGWVCVGSLAVALALTLYSLAIYAREYRRIFAGRRTEAT